MPRIVISYRRADSQAMTGRIHDRLVRHYGKGAVFMDLEIPYGTDFHKHIDDVLNECGILLAIIGPKWLGAVEGGGARIADQDDPVRIEIETALNRQIPIIPVLIDDTGMPTAAQLPDTLKTFHNLNAAPIDAGRNFNSQMESLIHSMDAIRASKSRLKSHLSRVARLIPADWLARGRWRIAALAAVPILALLLWVLATQLLRETDDDVAWRAAQQTDTLGRPDTMPIVRATP